MILAFNTVLDRMSAPTGQVAPTPEKGWPNDTYDTPQKNLYFNGEAIQVFHQPATTDGNSFVFFRHSDVISTGDIFDPTEYPIIDLKSGGSLQAIIDGLFRIKQIAIPADHQEGGTMLVPGHGRICDVADLDVYHQMLVIIRDRLQDMIKRGMTLEQVKAAKPTLDYDPIYGSSTGNWTTDMFVEAAYKSLTAKPESKESKAGPGAN
jgi:glyoxylase-like metal-dependent hydrolase (beta-lactamase superfamily II)